jgi:uncharacterized protein with GYD domain
VQTYIFLSKLTDQGMRNIRKSPGRMSSGKKAAKQFGGRFRHWYLTIGAYDGVFVADFPNDNAAAQFVLARSSQGNIRFTMLTAFSESEFRKLVASLPPE